MSPLKTTEDYKRACGITRSVIDEWDPSDDLEEVRRLLDDQVVSDTTFYYCDLGVAYPRVKGRLQGLVELDWDGGMVSLKLIGFHAEPAVLLSELERALTACEMEQDDDEGEWSCLAEDMSSSGVLVEVYFAPGLVLLELGS